jgi:hypothetical protein
MQHSWGTRSENKSVLVRFLGCVLFAFGLGLYTSVVTEAATLTNGWRLVRIPNPGGGPEAISVDHTADVSRSDLDFAGLMLRCGEHAPEVAIIALTPFPPRANPTVSMGANGENWRFVAQVVPPGAELLLPQEATTLAYGPWQRAHELSVTVTSPDQSFSGIVEIDGLPEALIALTANCAPR